MNPIFVDTSYWIARINPRDQWHRRALELSSALEDAPLVTSASVLVELLNYFSGYGPEMRKAAARIVRHIIEDPSILVMEDFEDGLSLFEARPDKGYSMTDCISMSIMRATEVTEVLTHDHHFTQEGFIILL